MRFLKITDSNQLSIQNHGASPKEYKKAIKYLSNYYFVCSDDSQGLVRISDDVGEPLLLNIKEKTFGIKGFTIPCKLNPKASSEAIEKLLENFNTAYNSRN